MESKCRLGIAITVGAKRRQRQMQIIPNGAGVRTRPPAVSYRSAIIGGGEKSINPANKSSDIFSYFFVLFSSLLRLPSSKYIQAVPQIADNRSGDDCSM